MPFPIRRKMLIGAAVLAAAVTTGVAYLGPISLGSSQWQSIEPKYLAMLPELGLIAPLIQIDKVMVYGFQDKVYRFRFKPAAGLSLPELVQHLRRDDAYTVPKDDVAALAQVLRVLEAVPGAPDWWTLLKRQDPRRPLLLLSMVTASRDVVLILHNDYGYGQLTER